MNDTLQLIATPTAGHDAAQPRPCSVVGPTSDGPDEPRACAGAECDALAAELGTSLLRFDPSRGVLAAAAGQLPWVPADAAEQAARLTAPARLATLMPVDLVAAPLPRSGHVAVAVLPFAGSEPPADAVIAAADAGWSHEELTVWWSRGHEPADSVLGRLRLITRVHQAALANERLEWELESMAEQIDSTYEEISLLHFLAQNLHVSRETGGLAGMCLSRMRESLACEGAVVWLETLERSEFHIDGTSPVDEAGLAVLLSRFDRHHWPTPLVRNHCTDDTLGISGVTNLVVVPVTAGERRAGWLACFNASRGREFGTVEASLAASVAVSLGTHLQNAAVVSEQEEMLLSFVRSLVSSLDAKDPYTRGHSERVAAIGRRLAEQLGLPSEEVEAVYLAGLLHDVGKIGVSDDILRKPGKLTDDEFTQIQQHPMIGYQILGGISRLRHVLPGVRSHHESMDGSGYPDGLAGDEIPPMARILAVADSYDAMGSDRPYRSGMPLEKLERILRDGAGTQWDAAIIEAYFACRDDVLAICVDWAARQPA